MRPEMLRHLVRAGIADIRDRAAILEAGRALADGPCGTALSHGGLQSGQAVLMG